jgi:hypothetical protein
MRPIRLYWPALVVAMLVSFLFEAGWFSFFLKPWLAGIGRSMEWLMSQPRVTLPIQFAVALLCSFVTAAVLSVCIQASGEQTFFRGIKVAAVLWLGFIATTLAKDYIFEVRPLSLFAINAAYGLCDLVLMGAIVGAWKGKPKAFAVS